MADENNAPVEATPALQDNSTDTAASDTTSSTDSGSYDEGKTTSDSSLPETGSYEEDFKQKFEQLAPKVSKLESDNTRYEAEITNTRSQLDSLVGIVRSDPDIARRVMSKAGMSEYEINDAMAKMGGQVQPQQTQQQPQYNQEELYKTLNYVKEQAKQDAVHEVRGLQTIEKFYKNIPEMDPANFSREEMGAKKELFAKVEDMAYSIQRAKGIGTDDALVEAYRYITGKTQEEVSQAHDNGRLEGMAARNAQNASVINSGVPGKKQSNASVLLNQAEKEIADSRGWSYEDFAKAKTDPKYN